MDNSFKSINQDSKMNDCSTDYINNTCSRAGALDENESYREIEYYTSELCNENINFKRNALKHAIGLSAQVMNLPYNELKKSISNEGFDSPNNFSLEECDIFKRIKEAYEACSCMICKCVTGKTLTPKDEYCDCQPCNCKDCTVNNLRFKGINIQSPSGNKTYNKCNLYEIIKETKCNCKPCECIECVQNCSLRSKPGYFVQNKMVVARNMVTKNPARQNSLQEKFPTQDTYIKSYKLPERPSSINKSYSNIKCACSVCECIVCECQGTVSSCSSPMQYSFYERAKCKCQLCSHKNQPPQQSMYYTKCTCTEGQFVHSARDTKNTSNKLVLDKNYGGTDKAARYVVYPAKNKHSIARIMRQNPLTYECNEYVKGIQSRTESRAMTFDKFKQGHISYVSNEKIYAPTKRILQPVRPRVKENNLDLLVNKDNYETTKNKKGKSKLSPFEKNSTVLTLLEDVPMNGKTSSYLLLPELKRLRQTITVPSSILSYDNKGHCIRTKSSPNKNIDANLTRICSNSSFNEMTKHVNQPSICQNCNIQTYFSKTNDIKSIHYENPGEHRKIVAGNLFKHFDKYFSKSSGNIMQTNKEEYDSAHKTIQNAKQFTLNLTKILLKYEKDNLEFKSVSKALKKSLYMILNGISSTNCDNIIKKAAAVDEKHLKVKPNVENKADTELIKDIFPKIKKYKEENTHTHRHTYRESMKKVGMHQSDEAITKRSDKDKIDVLRAKKIQVILQP